MATLVWHQRRRHIICANYRQRVAIFCTGNDAAGSLDSLSIYDSHSVSVSIAGLQLCQADCPSAARHRCETSTAQHNVYQPQSFCSSSWSCSCSSSSPRLHELHKSSPNCTKVCLALRLQLQLQFERCAAAWQDISCARNFALFMFAGCDATNARRRDATRCPLLLPHS